MIDQPEIVHNVARNREFQQKEGVSNVSAEAGEPGIRQRPIPESGRSGPLFQSNASESQGAITPTGQIASAQEASPAQEVTPPHAGTPETRQIPVFQIVTNEQNQPREGLSKEHVQVIAEDMKANGYDQNWPIDVKN